MFNFNKLKKNKIYKTLMVLLAIYMCIVAVTSIIVATDINHILNCDEDECLQCAIIYFCQAHINYMYLLNPPIIITLLLIMSKQKFINIVNEINKSKTLIESKVQLNN